MTVTKYGGGLKLFIWILGRGSWSIQEETTPEDVHFSLSKGDGMSSCLCCQSVSAFITTAKHS